MSKKALKNFYDKNDELRVISIEESITKNIEEIKKLKKINEEKGKTAEKMFSSRITDMVNNNKKLKEELEELEIKENKSRKIGKKIFKVLGSLSSAKVKKLLKMLSESLSEDFNLSVVLWLQKSYGKVDIEKDDVKVIMETVSELIKDTDKLKNKLKDDSDIIMTIISTISQYISFTIPKEIITGTIFDKIPFLERLLKANPIFKDIRGLKNIEENAKSILKQVTKILLNQEKLEISGTRLKTKTQTQTKNLSISFVTDDNKSEYARMKDRERKIEMIINNYSKLSNDREGLFDYQSKLREMDDKKLDQVIEIIKKKDDKKFEEYSRIIKQRKLLNYFDMYDEMELIQIFNLITSQKLIPWTVNVDKIPNGIYIERLRKSLIIWLNFILTQPLDGKLLLFKFSIGSGHIKTLTLNSDNLVNLFLYLNSAIGLTIENNFETYEGSKTDETGKIDVGVVLPPLEVMSQIVFDIIDLQKYKEEKIRIKKAGAFFPYTVKDYELYPKDILDDLQIVDSIIIKDMNPVLINSCFIHCIYSYFNRYTDDDMDEGDLIKLKNKIEDTKVFLTNRLVTKKQIQKSADFLSINFNITYYDLIHPEILTEGYMIKKQTHDNIYVNNIRNNSNISIDVVNVFGHYMLKNIGNHNTIVILQDLIKNNKLMVINRGSFGITKSNLWTYVSDTVKTITIKKYLLKQNKRSSKNPSLNKLFFADFEAVTDMPRDGMTDNVRRMTDEIFHNHNKKIEEFEKLNISHYSETYKKEFERFSKEMDDFNRKYNCQHKEYMICVSEINNFNNIDYNELLTSDEKFNKFINSNAISTFIGEDCSKNFLDSLPTNSTIYFHNLAYDFSFIARKTIIQSEVKRGTSLLGIDCIYNGKKLQFKDSLGLITTALFRFPRMFNLPNIEKEIMPYGMYNYKNIFGDISQNINSIMFNVVESLKYLNESDKLPFVKNISNFMINTKNIEEIKNMNNLDIEKLSNMNYKAIDYAKFYCERDVDVLRKGFIKFVCLTAKNFNINPIDFLTIASMSSYYVSTKGLTRNDIESDCKHIISNDMNNNNHIYKVSGILRNYISQFVYGGRCMTAKNEKWHVKKDIVDFDATSLYPTAMSRLVIPTGEPIKVPKTFKDYSFIRKYLIPDKIHFDKNVNYDNIKQFIVNGLLEVQFDEVDIKNILDFPYILVKKDGLNNHVNEGGIFKFAIDDIENIVISHDIDPKNITIIQGIIYVTKGVLFDSIDLVNDPKGLDDVVNRYNNFLTDMVKDIKINKSEMENFVIETRQIYFELEDSIDTIIKNEFNDKKLQLPKHYINKVLEGKYEADKSNNDKNLYLKFNIKSKNKNLLKNISNDYAPFSILNRNYTHNKIFSKIFVFQSHAKIYLKSLITKYLPYLKDYLHDHQYDKFVNLLFNESYRCINKPSLKLSDTIKTMFTARLEAKKVKNPIQEVYKLLLNSSYGKMIQKPIKTKNTFKTPSNADKFHIRNYMFVKSRVDILQESINSKGTFDKLQTKFTMLTEVEKDFTNAPIGVFILAKSRKIMRQVMNIAKNKNIQIFYQDTDSIQLEKDNVKIISEEFEKLYNQRLLPKGYNINGFKMSTEELKENNLTTNDIEGLMGNFHPDYETLASKGILNEIGVEGIFLGKKLYCIKTKPVKDDEFEKTGYAYHIRMKGVPNKTIEYYINKDLVQYIDENKNNVVRLPKMYEESNIKFLTAVDLYEFLLDENNIIEFDLIKSGGVSFQQEDDYRTISLFNFTRRIQAKGKKINKI